MSLRQALLRAAEFTALALTLCSSLAHADVAPQTVNALLKAIYYDDAKSVTEMISQVPELKGWHAGETKNSPLYFAVLVQSPNVLQALLHMGFYVDDPAVTGVTALHLAAFHDDLQACRILRAAGASLARKNDMGETPLSLAKARGSLKCLAEFAK